MTFKEEQLMSSLKDGKYEVVAEELEGATMPLEVEITDGKLNKITTKRDASTALEETVFSKGTSQIIKNQNLDMDAITGATVSSNGLINAVADAIEQAGGNPADYRTKTEVTPAAETSTTEVEIKENDDYSSWRKVPENITKEISTDYLVVGAGIAGLASAVQAREIL